MPAGSCARLSELPPAIHEVLLEARRAVMTTIDPGGQPHAVPVIFSVYGDALVSPIDRKPKSGKRLVRLRNLERNPRVTLLADRWSEDWHDLAWVMIRGLGAFQPAEDSTREVEAIIARFQGYREELEGSGVIRIEPQRVSWWSWRDPASTGAEVLRRP